MTDENKSRTTPKNKRKTEDDGKWSMEAKVGAAAAIGSAALVAALLFTNRNKKDRKLEPQSPEVPPSPPAPNQTGDSE